MPNARISSVHGQAKWVGGRWWWLCITPPQPAPAFLESRRRGRFCALPRFIELAKKGPADNAAPPPAQPAEMTTCSICPAAAGARTADLADDNDDEPDQPEQLSLF
jgi:hypothetical protein